MIQSNKLPLFIIVVALSNLALVLPVRAVDPSDTFYGGGAGGGATGTFDSAFGYGALDHHTSGNYNTASGAYVLFNNTTGSSNTASGYYAMLDNTTGNYNVAEGFGALLRNITGGYNIAVGTGAGSYLTTGSYNIDIGNAGVAAESRTIRLGTKGTQTSTYIAGISGVAVAGGVGVIIDSNGRLGTVVSSVRFKDEIKPMNKASEAILSLRPVTFRYKKELDPNGIAQFGLVAEDVEKVNPDLVACDEEGRPYTVRYEAVNAMLLNEFLKEHRKVHDMETTIAQQEHKIQKQEATIMQLQERMENVLARLEAQESQTQKVSAQL
jgi:hypothetical protein